MPLLTRLRFLLRVYSMKLTISLFLRLMRLAAVITRRTSTLPTYTKRYAIRPSLSNRVFIPKSHVPGTTHPLLIMIHGGGFALCEPSLDDFFNRAMADQHGFVVVSVNYRKAPSHAFPVPVHDCAEITRAVLSDGDLPVDLARQASVSLGGFSAGGNLALAIAQLPGIKERVGSIVPVYPVVDFTGKFKGPYRPTPDGKEDRLKEMGPVFTWAYIPVGQDLADPLLSPICVRGREALPQRIFFVGAEYDYLCHEAEAMAIRLAYGVSEDSKEKVEELGDEWEKEGIKWKNVKGVVHGWTHIPEKGEKDILKQNQLKSLYREIAEWLNEE
jgi:acetyl esterase/lipase